MPIPTRVYDRTINAEIERLIYQINVIKMDAEGIVHGLTDAQFNWSPALGGWSIAECYDHLNVTARLYLKEFDQCIEKAKKEGKLSDGPYSYGLLSRIIMRKSEPPVTTKFKAPKAFRPAGGQPLEKVTSEFMVLRDRVIDAMKRANGLDLASVKVRTPISRFLHFNLGAAFWILAAHDRRHLWQARQVRNDAAFPK